MQQLRDTADRVGGYAMMMTLAADYIDAMRARVPMRKPLDALLARYDALVTPTRTRWRRRSATTSTSRRRAAALAGSRPARRPPATIPAGNLAGLPALCVPNGFGQHGLPTSLQLLGRAFSEATLVAVASRTSS